MDYRGVTQKTYKNVKKEVTESTPLEIGYYLNVIQEINNELLMESIKTLATSGAITDDIQPVVLNSMIVGEAVRNMSYQEFKDVAPYFFNFKPDDSAQFQRVSEFTTTKEDYYYLLERSNELGKLEAARDRLENKIHDIETREIETGDKVIGVDLDANKLLLLKSPENSFVYSDYDYYLEDDRILTDFYDSRPSEIQILEKLSEEHKEVDIFVKNYAASQFVNSTGSVLYDEYMQQEFEDEFFTVFPEYEESDSYLWEDLEEIVNAEQLETHEEYYDWAARNFEKFAEKYPTYESYIDENIQEFYPEYLEDNARVILEREFGMIDDILEKSGKTLVLETIYGYNQGDVWTVGGVTELSDLSNLQDFINYEIAGWLKGDLADLYVVDLETIKDGEAIEYDDVYSVNVAEINYYGNSPIATKDNLSLIQEKYPELKTYKSLEEVNNQKEVSKEKGRSI